VNPESLIATLLAAPDENTLQDLLTEHRAKLTPRLLTIFEERVNSLRLQDPRQAERTADLMLYIAAFLSDERLRANALRLKGNSLIPQGRYEESIACYSKAKEIRGRYGESLEIARLQIGWMGALKELARYEEALQLGLATQPILIEYEKWDLLANQELSLGSTYRLLDRYKDALITYDQCRLHFLQVGNFIGVAQAQVNAARVLGSMDRFREAQNLLLEARTVFAEHRKNVELARTDLNLAILAYGMGHYQQAWETFGKARAEFAALGNALEMASVDLYSSQVFLALNLFPEALEAVQRARPVFEREKMVRHVALSDFFEAAAYGGLGEISEALRLYERAREFFVQNWGDVWASQIDLNRAALLLREHHSTEAFALVKAALTMFTRFGLASREMQARLLLAECLFELASLAEAEALYYAVLESTECLPALDYRAHFGLGQIAEARRDKETAIQHYQAAIAKVEVIRHSMGVDEFKASFLDDKLPLYEAAVRLSVETGRVTEAFNYAEQAKSAALLDILALSLEMRATEETVEPALWARLETLKEAWFWQYSKLERPPMEGEDQPRGSDTQLDTWLALRQIESELHQVFQQLQVRRGDFWVEKERLALTKIQDCLSEDALLVEYFSIGDELLAFLLDGKGLKIVRDFPYSLREVRRSAGILELAMKNLSGLDSDYIEKVLTPLAQRYMRWLYDALLKPLAAHLNIVRKVVIVPHDVLYYLPFHALHDGERYFIEQHEMQYAPSAAVWWRCYQKSSRFFASTIPSLNGGGGQLPTPCPSLAAPPNVGGSGGQGGESSLPSFSQNEEREGLGTHPKPSSGSYPDERGEGMDSEGIGEGALVFGYSDGGRLPFVSEEVREIATVLFPLLFEENDATLTNLRTHANDARLVHLAAHSVFRDDNPLFSFIRLADMPLNVMDIYNLQLHAALVVLSACETGRGQLRGAELFGLARGCLHAGAPSLVVSLWQVHDHSTALLMAEFYRQLTKGESFAAALRGAQLQLLKGESPYTHPHYWAPFFLMGADGNL
jgi:tetratricopeptide (TPR) repeat protein